ncbi:c-type cytochrome [Pseudomonadota bacterium]
MNKTTLIFIILLSQLTTSLVNTAWAENPKQRWYTNSQVTQGKALYSMHCAECHGNDAEATPDWRKSDKDGSYPPPPLNGSAHAWHHPLAHLRLTIRFGGARYDGKMPPFDDKLSADQIDSIIAWFQSLWPDEAYSRWLERGKSQISTTK